MTLGEKLNMLRKSNGMSQEELASQITVSRQAVSKWELNESVPDTENLIRISEIFHVSIDFLVNDKIETPSEVPIVKKTFEKADEVVKKNNNKWYIIVIIFCVLILAIIGTGNLFHITGTLMLGSLLLVTLLVLFLIIRFIKKRI